MAEKSKWQSSKKPEPSNVVTSTSLHKEDAPAKRDFGTKLPPREPKPEQEKPLKGAPFVQPSSADAQRFEKSKEDKKAAKEAEG